jgi:putative membrane protein
MGDILGEAERLRIQAAITAAEVHTAGEIYVVISRETADFRCVPALWAAVIALLSPWPLHLLTSWSTTVILIIQAGIFVAVATVASLPSLRRWVVPGGLGADATRREATAQFLAHGIHLTEARTGVLIYVALQDRRVEIVADDGIHAKVGQSDWDSLARDIVVAAGRGQLTDGVVSAVARAGDILSRHFPPQEHDINEIPDRVVEI